MNTGNETSRVAQYFGNPGVASTPAPYTLGNRPRLSDIFAPGTKDADLALFGRHRGLGPSTTVL